MNKIFGMPRRLWVPAVSTVAIAGTLALFWGALQPPAGPGSVRAAIVASPPGEPANAPSPVGASPSPPVRPGPSAAAPAPTRAPSPSAPDVLASPRPAAHPVSTVLGHSVQGRPITATELGDPAAPRKLLVVGCIHGNESAGVAIARDLESMTPPPGTDVWVIEDLNPDGVALGTRQNANQVDLNRNFPFGWAALGSPGSQQYAGPRPLSEPESQLAYDLINRLHPSVSIWFHQPLSVIDLSGGDPAVEQRYAGLVGLPTHQLARYPGSVTTWEDQSFPGSTAFVAELPAGSLSAPAAQRYADAALQLLT